MAEAGLGGRGVLVGKDLLGGTFTYDPFVLYSEGVLTNPNMVVFGQIGRGKSSFVKTYLWRQAVFGRRAWVIDPKGEYRQLAETWGSSPLSLRPGGSIRLNPLEAALAVPGADPDEAARRRAELLVSLAAATLGRSVLPAERAAMEVAVAEVSPPASELGRRRTRGLDEGQCEPTLPDVVEALLRPSARAARALRTDVRGLTDDGRNVALELRRLVAGDLRGMFDGPTSREVSLDGSLVVLDLSAVYNSAALGVLMTCAAAWLQARLSSEGGAGDSSTILVVDEAWAIVSNVFVARWLQSAWKLSRAWGVSNVAVLHRISDLDSAGAQGSEQRALASGLLADSETRVVYGQPHGELERATTLLGLSETEAELVPKLRRGVALWKVGSRSFLVHHKLSPYESRIVDTDGRMAQRTKQWRGMRQDEATDTPQSEVVRL
jgi:type IV secretory pathway VirB4 component